MTFLFARNQEPYAIIENLWLSGVLATMPLFATYDGGHCMPLPCHESQQ